MKKIEAYKTFDGAIFESEEKAKNREFDFMAGYLEPLLLQGCPFEKASQKIQFMDNLYTNREKVIKVLSQIQKEF